MITLLAVVALFIYVWRTRHDLDAAVDRLSRRIDALESTASRVVSPTPTPAPAPTRPPADWMPPRLTPDVAPSVMETPAPTVMSPAADASDSLETEIGSRWLLYVGILALVVGAAYFQKLAIDNGWIGERARVIEGLAAGLMLVAAGRWFIARGYDLYGQIVAGGGVAVLYVSVYAAATLYQLIGRGAAFAALGAVTIAAAVLADRYRSQGLAIVAVGGGFLTPFLLPSDRDAQLALFTYDAILIGGTMYLAHRRVWPLLNVISYVATQLTVLAWAVAFYTPDKYLVTEAGLTVFCAMFLYIVRQGRGSDVPGAREAQLVLWTSPVVYYVASLGVLAPHSIALLVFLGIVASIGAGLTPQGLPLVRLAVWLAVAAPLLGWVSSHRTGEWLVPGLSALTGIYLVNLISHLYSLTRTARLAGPDIAMLHLNAAAAYVGAHWLLLAVAPDSASTLAFGFAAWNAAIAGWLWSRRTDAALHFGALATTLLAIAIGLEFDGPARILGWAGEGAAVIWLGVREQRRWLQAGGLLVFAMATLQLLELLLESPGAGYVVIANSRAACGLFIVALTYVLAWTYRSAPGVPVGPASFVVAANLLTLFTLTSEINAYWHVQALVADEVDLLGRQLMLSVTWALYATVLITVGLRRSYAPIRYLAIAIFAVTIVKVFLFDLAELDQIYRVLSVIALGALLLLTSYLYNKRARRHSG